ncbi:nucleotidyltransferase family protein [Allosphingosinicella flava]|uniref:Nucleotidyltransferase family protein n=1 Tax=Allosphingosinicella flava TaxID=2771430 RepID=A0A7T2GK95_9SPHN|nr:nucleotidyltransferase family protein [Sphingosinicella flava]QPQ55401.1 nucleotidyltransferase family protein [Sphingosinicella flava]
MSDTLQILDTAHFEPPPEAVDFYRDSLALLKESGIPFLLSGTYALSCFTGIVRPTKDLDVFCKPSDAPKILAFFKARGYEIEVEDERWIGKVWKGDNFFDVIFNISSASIPITDEWFARVHEAQVYGTTVRITPPTEFVLSKIFLQTRYRYDGADVAHTILKQHSEIDWRWLLSAMELYWEVLLIQVLNFRFIYPTERDLIPRWLFDELIDRVKAQAELPAAGVKICRGRLLSPRDFVIDISEWGFADVVGKGIDEKHERPKHH